MKIINQERLIKLYRDYFHFKGMRWPENSKDALDFAVTEMGEVFDAVKRTEDSWVRHNERDRDLGMEISQTIMMLLLAAHAEGIDVQEATYKWMRSKGFEPDYFTGEDYTTWAKPTANSEYWHIWGRFGTTIQSACGLEFPPESAFYDWKPSGEPPIGKSLCKFCQNYRKSRKIVEKSQFGKMGLGEQIRIILGKTKGN
jgi:NTP pyrophosphatase (non-canonical NTP hydrolase)